MSDQPKEKPARARQLELFYLPKPPRPEIIPAEKPVLHPEAIYHVGVSGGKDSAAVLLWLVHESGIPRERIKASFSDIGNDHAWTKEHVQLLSEKVHPIETIKPELDFFELALKKKRFPSAKARFCTQHLKIYPSQDHMAKLREQYPEVVMVSGVRSDESIARSQLSEWDYNGNLLCHSWRPLIQWTIDDVVAIHKKYNIPLNPLYALGARRVGCWPCIMSRKEEIRAIALNFPERIDEIREQELRHEREHGRFSSFFGINVAPKRFYSRIAIDKNGVEHRIPTIDDVVKWSLTGKRAQGSHLDDPDPEPMSCSSGFCE